MVATAQALEGREINVLDGMKFHTIRPISRNDLPLGRGRNRYAGLRHLSVFREINNLLDRVNSEGLNPCEVVGEIDVTTPEITIEATRRKSFVQSFKTLVTECVKKHGFAGKIDVMQFDNGKRFFLVGREV